MKLVILAESGNAAFSSACDAVDALRVIADALETGKRSGTVRDDNGNTVGTYALTFDNSEEG